MTKATTRGVLWKKVFLDVSQNLRGNTCAKYSSTGVFLRILQSFWGHLFYRTPPEDCFWRLWVDFVIIFRKSYEDIIRGHPLSTFAKFSEKLTFLIPWYAHVRVCLRGLEMLVSRKILRTYLMDSPWIKFI